MRTLILFVALAVFGLGIDRAQAEGPDITEIVDSQAAYEADPNSENRAALLEALRNYSDSVTVETVNAYLILMLNDATNGNNEAMLESADAAAKHFEPVAQIIPKPYIEAKFVAGVSRFNKELTPNALREMAEVEGFANSHRDSTGKRPEWADSLKWKAFAWGRTMAAYFDSLEEPRPSDFELSGIRASYGSAETSADRGTSTSSDRLPHCSGRMRQTPKIRYPGSRLNRGMFGTVVLELEFDAEGKVINPVVLASVPVGEFDDRSIYSVKKWKFIPDDPGQVGVTCRLNRKNVIQPLTFQID